MTGSNRISRVDAEPRLKRLLGLSVVGQNWARVLCLVEVILLNACNANTVKPEQVNTPVGGEGTFFPAQANNDTRQASAANSSTPTLTEQSSQTANPASSATAAAVEVVVENMAASEPVVAKAIPLSQPPRPTKTRSKRTTKDQNSLYDRSNPAYDQLQKANQALAGFPADNSGQVDWVAALRQSRINPRARLHSQGTMEILTQELIMKNTREMPWVRFPHEAHTQWLACKNCHDAIFKPVQGGQKITMDDIFRGQYCGVCHDRVSFSVFTCERCHSVVHPDSPKAWWTQ